MPTFDLRIHLAGLALYVVDKGGQRVAVFFPDCRASVNPVQPDDDVDGVPHVGFVRMDAASLGCVLPTAQSKAVAAAAPSNIPQKPEFEVVRLFDCEDLDLGLDDGPVKIAGMTANTVDDKDDELLLPKFDRFADTLVLNDDLFDAKPQNVLMRTMLKGGKFESMNSGIRCDVATTLHSQRTTYTRQLANAVRWTRTIEGKDLTIRIKPFGGTATSVTLKPVVENGKKVISLMLANLCSDNPLEWEDFGLPEQRSRIDEDFKWLYRLLHPRGKSYKQALGRNGQLPVPIAQEAVSTGDLILCYGARKEDDVPQTFGG